MFFHESGFEPFLEHGFFHGNMAKKPFVRNGVETAFDVAFQHPLRRMLPGKEQETPFHRICR